MKSKYERAKCKELCKNEIIGARGNIGLKFKNKACESKVAEIVKRIGSIKNLEEHMQNKHDENGNMQT